jgi:hypothetical protein
MSSTDLESPPLLELGIASAARDGESECGDHGFVHQFAESTLVGVVDGLGHGHEACAAAHRAVAALAVGRLSSLVALVHRCHEALGGTRGAALSLASFNGTEDTMTWLGVGNVNGLLVRADPAAVPRTESVMTRGGIVGATLPQLRTTTLSMRRGDVVVFATDGVGPDYSKDMNTRQPARTIADRLLRAHRNRMDDSLVLVARYQRATPGGGVAGLGMDV